MSFRSTMLDHHNWEVTVPELVTTNLLENQLFIYQTPPLMRHGGSFSCQESNLFQLAFCPKSLEFETKHLKKKNEATLLGHNYLSIATSSKHIECLSDGQCGSCAHVLLTSRHYAYSEPSMVKKTSIKLKKQLRPTRSFKLVKIICIKKFHYYFCV